ncbi:MAG: hypothetical protein OXH70_17735 [Acidobacteria bacterium]|nr:hypothetical protein [Acidobacteriota bacterium]
MTLYRQLQPGDEQILFELCEHLDAPPTYVECDRIVSHQLTLDQTDDYREQPDGLTRRVLVATRDDVAVDGIATIVFDDDLVTAEVEAHGEIDGAHIAGWLCNLGIETVALQVGSGEASYLAATLDGLEFGELADGAYLVSIVDSAA